MHQSKRAPVISLTIFFLILLSTGLSGYYFVQGFIHGFGGYMPILASTLLLDGLGIFALVFKVSFETRSRAMVPFICSISLLIVCAIHLAALANARINSISQDEADSRAKTRRDEADSRAKNLDDDRHKRNVQDARELVELNCADCSPERKRRMYQSEMNRLEKSKPAEDRSEKASAIEDDKPADPDQAPKRSWGRVYIESYVTAVQLITGLLAGLGMLINNFLRLYAKEPKEIEESSVTFPSELDTGERETARRPKMERGKSLRSKLLSFFTPKTPTPGDPIDDPGAPQIPTPAVQYLGLAELRDALKVIAFRNSPGHFKVYPKPNDKPAEYLLIRFIRSNHGTDVTTHSTKVELTILDDARKMEPEAFRAKLARHLKRYGFPIEN